MNIKFIPTIEFILYPLGKAGEVVLSSSNVPGWCRGKSGISPRSPGWWLSLTLSLSLTLWKTWVSWHDDVPNWMDKNSSSIHHHLPNHQAFTHALNIYRMVKHEGSFTTEQQVTLAKSRLMTRIQTDRNRWATQPLHGASPPWIATGL